MEACNNNPPPPPVAAGNPTPPVTVVTADGTVPPPPGVVVWRASRGKKGGQEGGNKKGAGQVCSGGRPGARNYSNDTLINIVDEGHYTSLEGWKALAIEYQQRKQEETLCAAQDIQEHWTKKLCNNYKKPMGKSGEVTDHVHRCICIDREIGLQQDAGILGVSSE